MFLPGGYREPLWKRVAYVRIRKSYIPKDKGHGVEGEEEDCIH